MEEVWYSFRHSGKHFTPGFLVVSTNILLKPFTSFFPRADIHELLTPDLLHQVIKGTFKDHIVTWVNDYITENNSAEAARRIIDDIDRK
jgi:hypothetical protein